jgi:hypothetical protein
LHTHVNSITYFTTNVTAFVTASIKASYEYIQLVLYFMPYAPLIPSVPSVTYNRKIKIRVLIAAINATRIM